MSADKIHRLHALRAYAAEELEQAKRGGRDSYEHALEARSALLRALELERELAA